MLTFKLCRFEYILFSISTKIIILGEILPETDKQKDKIALRDSSIYIVLLSSVQKHLLKTQFNIIGVWG